MIAERRMNLITYGCGDAFDMAKFEPVRNRNFLKPYGGLWASPVDAEYGWREWCMDESYGDLTTNFTFWFTGNVLTINSRDDALAMPWFSEGIPGLERAFEYPDYEAMARAGIDAVHVTSAGVRATRDGRGFSRGCLYGWDCDALLIMNPAGIEWADGGGK